VIVDFILFPISFLGVMKGRNLLSLLSVLKIIEQTSRVID